MRCGTVVVMRTDLRLDAATAARVAATLHALATPSRLLILATLREGPQSVGALAAAVGMGQSAVSHQLRVLRDLGLVADERHGRHVHYRLYDDHVLALLEQAIHHAEHLRPDAGGTEDAPLARTGTEA